MKPAQTWIAIAALASFSASAQTQETGCVTAPEPRVPFFITGKDFDVAATLKGAREAMQSGDLPAAIEMLEQVIHPNRPKDPDVLHLLSALLHDAEPTRSAALAQSAPLTLQPFPIVPPPEKARVREGAYVNVAIAHVRGEPSEASPLIARLPIGTWVRVDRIEGAFAAVRFHRSGAGLTPGFILFDLLSAQRPTLDALLAEASAASGSNADVKATLLWRALNLDPLRADVLEALLATSFAARRYGLAVDAVELAIKKGRWARQTGGTFPTASALRAHLYRATVAKNRNALDPLFDSVRPVIDHAASGPSSLDPRPAIREELSNPDSSLWAALQLALVHARRGYTQWFLVDADLGITLESTCAGGWRITEVVRGLREHTPMTNLFADKPVTLDSSGVHRFGRACTAGDGALLVDGSASLWLTANERTLIRVGSASSAPASLRVFSTSDAGVYFQLDKRTAPINVHAYVPNGSMGSSGLGKHPYSVGGTSYEVSYGHGGSEGVGPPAYPASWPLCSREHGSVPDELHPPSLPRAKNCGKGSLTRTGELPSNYVQAAPAGQNAELHVISAYQGANRAEPIAIEVAASTKPVVLVLAAYRPNTWKVTLEKGAKLTAIYVTSAMKPQTINGVPADLVKDLGVDAWVSEWEPEKQSGTMRFSTFMKHVRDRVGLVESSYQFCYEGGAFDVPPRD